jgi:hypothetical protein
MLFPTEIAKNLIISAATLIWSEGQRVPVKNIQNIDSFALGPFFGRFFKKSGPSGTRWKNL